MNKNQRFFQGCLIDRFPLQNGLFRVKTDEFFSPKKRINRNPENFRIPDQNGFYFGGENSLEKKFLEDFFSEI